MATPTTNSPAKPAPVRPFMVPEALLARLQFLMAHVPLHEAHPDPSALSEHTPPFGTLFAGAEHGNITSVKPDFVERRAMVAVSIQGRTPRLMMPLDYVALDLATGFGLGLSIQQTSKDTAKRRDYPRITSPGPNGDVFQVLRIIADAQPGQLVKQKPWAGDRRGHRYLGRDGLTLTTDDAVRDEGKPQRYTTRGRADLIRCATEVFAANRDKLDLPPELTVQEYSWLLTLAFGLADWRYGRLDGQAPEILRPRPAAAA